ncbi:hypothetical protein [Paraglaciecola arctica]|uniref:hypothetical protein n=1 Tax=Paraglaciecola arctica TaxID=1128911 RepID=UPI001C074EEE|nr:hypothetical protein [Paraglaciecola arctica]MBU3001726.1 hypothetical protein [Paraglaciecola arctica]
MINTRTILKYTLIALLLGALWFSFLAVAYFNNVLLPWHRQEAIETALNWSRTADLPTDTDIVRIDVTGGFFSRGFELEFSNTNDAIKKWITLSLPSVNSAQIVENNGVTTYELHPEKDGAQYAKIQIDWQTSIVFIKVYWS